MSWYDFPRELKSFPVLSLFSLFIFFLLPETEHHAELNLHVHYSHLCCLFLRVVSALQKLQINSIFFFFFFKQGPSNALYYFSLSLLEASFPHCTVFALLRTPCTKTPTELPQNKKRKKKILALTDHREYSKILHAFFPTHKFACEVS